MGYSCKGTIPFPRTESTTTILYPDLPRAFLYLAPSTVPDALLQFHAKHSSDIRFHRFLIEMPFAAFCIFLHSAWPFPCLVRPGGLPYLGGLVLYMASDVV